MEPDDVVKRLFLPDGSPHGLSSAYAARSGSGKTHHLTYMVNRALKMPDFDLTRAHYHCSFFLVPILLRLQFFYNL